MTVETPPAPKAGNQENLTPDQRVALMIADEVRKSGEASAKTIAELRSLSTGQQARIEELSKEIVAFRARGRTGNGDIHEEDAKKFSWLRYLRGCLDGGKRGLAPKQWGDIKLADGTNCGWEGECIDHAMTRMGELPEHVRTNIVGTDTLGGYITPPQVGTEIIGRVIAESVCAGMGVQMPTVSGIPFTLPKVTGGSTVYWVEPDGGSPTKSTPTFGQVTWTPKRASVHTKISRMLLDYSNPAAEAIIRQIMAEDIALAQDKAILEGGGLGGEPLGLYSRDIVDNATTYRGVLTSTQKFSDGVTDGDYLLYDKVMKMVAQLAETNALKGSNLGFIGHPSAIKWLLMQTVENVTGQAQTAGKGQPIFAPFMRFDQLQTVTGYKWAMSTQISKVRTKGSGTALAATYLGDWGQVLAPMWGGLSFRASDVTGDSSGNALLQDQVWIVGNMRTDVNVRQQERFVIHPSCKTA